MELVDEKKCCVVSDTGIPHPCLKQVAVVWSVMAVLVVTMDLLSFAGLLPFPGGYTFPVIAFLYFTLGPRMCSIIATLGNCLTPAVLFLLMNVMIVAILLSSGFFSGEEFLSSGGSGSSSSSSSSNKSSCEQAPDVEHQIPPISKPRSLTRCSSDTGAAAAAARVKAVKKVKRQFSAPSPSRSKLRDELEEQERQQQDYHHHQLQQQQHHSSSLIIMELPSEAASAASAATAAAAAGGGGGGGKAAAAAAAAASSCNLMTCDQDAFNEIIGNYIDKFKQDMRQQEMIPARCW